ncbi:MAG: hypothetical protein GY854_15065 [Deltaproteobacteria bacterium]|nr:hypothetical protein [Deltaproteobacteria bacterium]
MEKRSTEGLNPSYTFRSGALVALFFFLACSSPPVATVAPRTKTDYTAFLPQSCEASRSPLFRDIGPNDLLEVEFISNFDVLGREPPTVSTQKGVLRYVDPDGHPQFVGALVRVDGNLRSHCEHKPLRLELESEIVMVGVVDTVTHDPGAMDRLRAIYEEYLSTDGEAQDKKGVPQENNIFAHLGDDIKIMTHCGVHEWDRIGGKDAATQRAHLLQEYYLYQLLDLARTTTFKTRLVRLTFRSADGAVLGTYPAFFKEPKTELARRCGLKVMKNPEGEVNKVSYINFHLLNFLAMNEDFDFPSHNVVNLRDGAGVRFLVPYDFDLSEVSNPQYADQIGPVVARFLEWTSDFQYDDIALAQVVHLLSRQDDFRALFRQSLLDDESKKRALDWLDTAFETLRRFVYERPADELKHMEEIETSLLGANPT